MTLTRPGAAQTPSGGPPKRSAKAAPARAGGLVVVHSTTTAAQLLGDVLRVRVGDEHAHPRLRAGQVLQLAGSAAQREQLQVQPPVLAPAVHRRLVPRGDVGHRGVHAAREAGQHVEVDVDEGVALGVVERRQVGHAAQREELDLVGPPAGGGHEGGPVLVGRDHPRAAALGLDGLGEQVPAGGLPVPGHRGEHLLGPRGDERVGVDLPVRVGQRHPDLLAVVLEREDLLDPLDPRQLRRPLGPHVDDEAGALGAELGEHAVVLAGEADDLAPAEPGAQLRQRRPRCARRHVLRDRGGQRREAVLEDDDLVVGLRDLGLPAGPGRAQRALVGRAAGRCGSAGGRRPRPTPPAARRSASGRAC